MCEQCNKIGQSTFGEIVGMPPVVPVVSELPAAPVHPVDAEDDEKDDSVECESCSDSFDKKDIRISDDGGDYCENCYHENFSSCENCGEELDIQRGDEHSTGNDSNGYSYCEGCFDRLFTRCDGCSEHVGCDSTTSVRGGSDYCESCLTDSCGPCEDCGDWFHNDDLSFHERTEAYYCSRHLPTADDCKAKRFRAGSSFERIGSRRTFGVELETSNSDGYGDLDGETYFSAVEDGSVDGMEFVSAVLSSDKGLEGISEFCLEANSAGFKVDAKCGFHAHFGVSELSVEQRVSVLRAYKAAEKVWALFVSRERRGTYYCQPVGWGNSDLDRIDDEDDFNRFIQETDDSEGGRYQWLNVIAWSEHSTFEVRLHGATLNGQKVCNWVKAHARFIDRAATMSASEIIAAFDGKSLQEQFDVLADWFADSDLTEYLAGRAQRFGTRIAASQPAIA